MRPGELQLPRPFIRRALVLAAMMILPACSGTVGCEPRPRNLALAVPAAPEAAPLPPVCRGSELTIVVTPSADGVVHIHGYDAEAPATPVVGGEVLELSFTASRSGQFPIEFHTDESTEGQTVGILTVNEP
jgi:hypothetical protein